MSKSIGMLLDGFYPSDIRVQKEAISLIEAGFRVSLLCNRRKGEEQSEVVDGIQLMRINSGTSHSQKGFMDILIGINFVHPIFKMRLPHFIQKFSVEVLHVHDLPLVKTAINVSSKHGVRVIADFHENYPEALNVWFQWKKNPVIQLKNKLFFGYNRWVAYEKWSVRHADHIIAVVDEMKTRLISDHKVDEAKISVITNSENKSFVNSNLDKSIYKQDRNKFIIAYTGGVGPHRGVDTAIEALSLLKAYDDIVFYITGTLSDAARDMIEELIKEFGLEDMVKVLGYRPFSEFYSFMKMARINVIPHHSNGHTDNTIPHKLFQCMMTGKPLLVSSSTPLKRVVNETNSGLVFEAGNAKDLANRVIELYDDKSLCVSLGTNGVNASLEGDYNWEFSSKDLVDFYKHV